MLYCKSSYTLPATWEVCTGLSIREHGLDFPSSCGDRDLDLPSSCGDLDLDRGGDDALGVALETGWTADDAAGETSLSSRPKKEKRRM